MKIKMRTNYAGPGGVIPPGGTADMDDADAKDLIERGYATAVEITPQKAVIENALPPEPETAVMPETDKPTRRRHKHGQS